MPKLALALLLAAATAISPGAASAAWQSLNDAVAADVERVAPPLVTREQWKARAPLPGMKPQRPTGIIVHHTAVASNPRHPLETKLRNLQSFSQRAAPEQRRGAWGDVPYHYYIDMTGRIGEGRDVRFAGDTNTPYDTLGYVQVVLEGDFEKENPAPAQLVALQRLLASLMLSWNVPAQKITVHKDHGKTTCPGRNLLAVLPKLIASAAQERQRAAADVCARGPSAAFARLYCTARQ
jgi:hypothetical protein